LIFEQTGCGFVFLDNVWKCTVIDALCVNRQNSIMKDNSFSRLTISQQAEALLESGVYLLTREEPGFFVDSYEMHGLYIEIYFHKKQEDFVVIKTMYSSENVQTATTGDAELLYPLPLQWRCRHVS